MACQSFGCFACGLVLCACDLLFKGIMVSLCTTHYKTTQLINKTEINFSGLDLSRCLLKWQNYFCQESLCFLSVIDFLLPAFIFFPVRTDSLHYIFVMIYSI